MIRYKFKSKESKKINSENNNFHHSISEYFGDDLYQFGSHLMDDWMHFFCEDYKWELWKFYIL